MKEHCERWARNIPYFFAISKCYADMAMLWSNISFHPAACAKFEQKQQRAGFLRQKAVYESEIVCVISDEYRSRHVSRL
jgi:hypothetical protein